MLYMGNIPLGILVYFLLAFKITKLDIHHYLFLGTNNL